MPFDALANRTLKTLLIRCLALGLAALGMWPGASALGATRTFVLIELPAGAPVHGSPRGPVTAHVSGRTPLGAVTWLWAVRTSADGAWAKVVLPVERNGTTGWIRLRGRHIVRTATWVSAALDGRRLELMDGSRMIASFPTAIGAPATPTPTGRFSVTDLVATGDPSGPFGWFAFGLSGHQPNLPAGWSGGDQLAIHGTNAPSTIGLPASHGCLRVSSASLYVLRRHLRLGTPVIVARTARAALRQALPLLAGRPRPAAAAATTPPATPAEPVNSAPALATAAATSDPAPAAAGPPAASVATPAPSSPAAPARQHVAPVDANVVLLHAAVREPAHHRPVVTRTGPPSARPATTIRAPKSVHTGLPRLPSAGRAPP
jgi:hypothetical protein